MCFFLGNPKAEGRKYILDLDLCHVCSAYDKGPGSLRPATFLSSVSIALHDSSNFHVFA
jgi:hypothetical protein